MKSIKNVLFAGVALAIAFASVQITAMSKRENPYLSAASKEALRDALVSKDMYKNSKKNLPSEMVEKTREQKEAIKAILYGNQPYDKDDIHVAIYL